MNHMSNSATRSTERQYVGHRFLLTRSTRRNMPDYDDDASTLASVDTSFVRNLIDSTDKKFVDRLIASDAAKGSGDYDDDIDEQATPKSEKRWWLPKKCGHVICGMALMYVLLALWEYKRTKGWWDLYESQLDTSMYTRTMEQAKVPPALRGRNYDAVLRDPTSLYDPLAPDISGLASSTVDSNPLEKSSVYLPGHTVAGSMGEASISGQQRSDYARHVANNQEVSARRTQHDSLWHEANARAQVKTLQSSASQTAPQQLSTSQYRPEQPTEVYTQPQDVARMMPPPSLSYRGQSRQSLLSHTQQVGTVTSPKLSEVLNTAGRSPPEPRYIESRLG